MASTTFWARLVWATRELRLDEEPFMLMQDFNPPSVGRVVEYSQNIHQLTGGAKRIGESYLDKEWSFNVRISGANEEEVNGYINKLSTFIELARNSNSKLYFEYYPHNAFGYIPLYGQGVYRYYIKDGYCNVSSPWMTRDVHTVVTVNLTIAPQAEGSRQRLANAKGMVLSGERINGIDSVAIGYAGTNLVTNPVFSNTTAWDTGWLAGGSITVTKNTDPDYILFGDASAKISVTDDAGDGKYLSPVDVGTAGTTNKYCVSCYVKKPDNTAFGTSDFNLYFDTAGLGSFSSISIGNGWYRIYDYSGTPSGTQVSTGIQVVSPGVTFYMQGFQVEQTDAGLTDSPNLITFGDQPGVLWNGTRGSATSTAEGGAMKLLVDSDVIDIAKGVIRMAVKWNCNYNDTATQNFFNAGTAFRAYYAPALDKIVFDCCGTTISSGTQNFSIGDIYIYHFIWNNYPDENHAPGIYINANLSGTIGAYTTNTMDGNIFIGSNSTYTNQLKGEILDFTIFDVTPTKLQVIADYNQLNEWIRSGDGLGQPRNTIPYISTYGGGGTVNSYYDSTHQDWAICGNIPGNLPARTIFDVSLQLAGTSDAGLVMSNHSYVHYINKADEFYGTDSAGSVGTAWVSYPGTPIEILRDWSAYRGQKVYLSAVLTDAGTVDALGRMRIFYASGVNAYVSETTVLDTTAGGTQWYLLGPMIIPESMPSEYDWMNSYKELNYGFQLNRLTGGGTITMDFYRMLVGQTMYVSFSGMNGSGTQSAIIDGNNVYTYHSGKEDGFRVLYGDIIELEPYRYNHLVALPLKIGRTASTFDTVKFNRVYVIPRYSLL